MKIQLQDIEKAPLRFDESLELFVGPDAGSAGLEENSSLISVGEVRSHGELTFVDPGYLLRSRLEYERTLICDRCLEEFSEPVDEELTLIIARRSGEGHAAARELGDDIELEEEDLDVTIVDGDELDTAPLVQENVLLNVPMKPLCSPDCAGLCPECGQKKTAGCDCSVPVDDRWKALAALKDRLP